MLKVKDIMIPHPITVDPETDIENVVFGKYMDPRASQENFEAFVKAKGYEKCSLLPGIGARIAVEIIVESMENEAHCER